jgi:hypothetical protein
MQNLVPSEHLNSMRIRARLLPERVYPATRPFKKLTDFERRPAGGRKLNANGFLKNGEDLRPRGVRFKTSLFVQVVSSSSWKGKNRGS